MHEIFRAGGVTCKGTKGIETIGIAFVQSSAPSAPLVTSAHVTCGVSYAIPVYKPTVLLSTHLERILTFHNESLLLYQ